MSQSHVSRKLTNLTAFLSFPLMIAMSFVTSGCSNPTASKATESLKATEAKPETYSLPFIRRDAGNKSVIVFVHGITGDATSTWTNGTHYWPLMLTHDHAFDGQDVYVYSYWSPKLKAGLSIDRIADNMRVILADDGVLK